MKSRYQTESKIYYIRTWNMHIKLQGSQVYIIHWKYKSSAIFAAKHSSFLKCIVNGPDGNAVPHQTIRNKHGLCILDHPQQWVKACHCFQGKAFDLSFHIKAGWSRGREGQMRSTAWHFLLNLSIMNQIIWKDHEILEFPPSLMRC